MRVANLLVDGVAIDLDGTLIDTETEVCSAVNETLIRFGRTPLDAPQIVRLTGRGSRALIAGALSTSAPHSIDEITVSTAVQYFSSIYKKILGTQAKVYGGVQEGLKLLHGQRLRMMCVTNKSEPDALYLLKYFKLLNFFDAVLAPRSLDERKPAPFLLNKAAELLGIHPGRLVLIGDSNNDVLAARAACTMVIRLATGYDRHLANKETADLNCSTFLEAAQAIRPYPA